MLVKANSPEILVGVDLPNLVVVESPEFRRILDEVDVTKFSQLFVSANSRIWSNFDQNLVMDDWPNLTLVE